MYDISFLQEFGDYIHQLRFDQDPDYGYLIFLLKRNLLNKEIVPSKNVIKCYMKMNKKCRETTEKCTKENVSFPIESFNTLVTDMEV